MWINLVIFLSVCRLTDRAAICTDWTDVFSHRKKIVQTFWLRNFTDVFYRGVNIVFFFYLIFQTPPSLNFTISASKSPLNWNRKKSKFHHPHLEAKFCTKSNLYFITPSMVSLNLHKSHSTPIAWCASLHCETSHSETSFPFLLFFNLTFQRHSVGRRITLYKPFMWESVQST